MIDMKTIEMIKRSTGQPCDSLEYNAIVKKINAATLFCLVECRKG